MLYKLLSISAPFAVILGPWRKMKIQKPDYKLKHVLYTLYTVLQYALIQI